MIPLALPELLRGSSLVSAAGTYGLSGPWDSTADGLHRVAYSIIWRQPRASCRADTGSLSW